MKNSQSLLATVLAVAVAAAAAAAALSASAADLPSVGTNTIFGVVRFSNADPDILARLGPPGNEGPTSLVIVANSEPPDSLLASKYVSNPDWLANPYTLTVAADDVPVTYSVYASMSLDGTYEEYVTATQAAAPLTSNSPPAEVNLEECIGLIELRYQRADGSPVVALDGRGTVSETAPPNQTVRARYYSQPAGRTGNFLVVPSGVELQLAIEVDTGTDIYVDRLTHRETRVLTLNCDETAVIDITIPEDGALGRIVGQANLVGEIELPTDGYLELLGRPVIKARGPAGNRRYAALEAEFPGPDASRPFDLVNLAPSVPDEGWHVQAEMQFGDGFRFEYFATPAMGYGLYNAAVEATAGATTDLGDAFVMTPARLIGTLTLTGPPESAGNLSALRGVLRSADFDDNLDGIPDYVGASGINGSYVIAAGLDELAPGSTWSAAGGSATASFAGAFNPATSSFEGDYALVVGMLNDEPGVWRHDGLNLAIHHPGTNGGPFVDQTVYIFEDTPWQGVLGPGDQVTHDLRYGFAELCLRIKSPTPFYYPRVINSYGRMDGVDSENQPRAYQALIGIASAPPYTADEAVYEATVTLYVPEGAYLLQPAITIVDPDGGASDVRLPPLDVSVVAGERFCVDDCIRLVFTGPSCTTNFGFLTFVDAFACEATLTNLSLVTRPVVDPSVRLGYSDIRILEPVGVARTTLRTGHGLFPEFDGLLPAHRDYYSNMVITAEARDNKGRVVTRQIRAQYDFAPPTLQCPPDIVATSPDGGGVPVEFTFTATDNRPEPLRLVDALPPSGSVFPVGTTPVTCTAVDLCRNTNTCTFNVTILPPGGDCVLSIALIPLTDLQPPSVTLTWDCPGVLQCSEYVDGPWEDLPLAASPHTTAAGPSRKFFRVLVSTPQTP